jgi:hypothetical protein
MSMKNSNDTIGNQTRYLLAGSAVPQPTAPPRALKVWNYNFYLVLYGYKTWFLILMNGVSLVECFL